MQGIKIQSLEVLKITLVRWIKNVLHAIRRYFEFDTREILEILVLSIVASAVLKLMEFELPSFLAFSGVFFIIILVKISFQKIVGILYGYKVNFFIDEKIGIIPTLFFTIIPFPFKLFYTGTVKVSPIDKLRIGYKTKELRLKSKGLISVAGIVPMILILIIFKTLDLTYGSYETITIILYLVIISSLLPIFHYDGFNLLYASRTTYVFYTTMVVLFLILINFISSLFWSVVLALIFASMASIIYYLQLESPLRE